MQSHTLSLTADVWQERRSWQGDIGRVQRQSRDGYARDRSRIIHSASFRRLQAKTQVLGLHESDFYRTRLTHSLEVAQIGSGIVEQLQQVKHPAQDWLPSDALIEAICMAHDIGHPPFGHGGEVALNFMMRNHGGFEGNGQTLRILSRLGEHSHEHGQDVTRRTLLGVMKYPVIYEQVVRQDDLYQQAKLSIDYDFKTLNMKPWLPPKAIFAEEADVRDWVLNPFSAADQLQFIRAEAQTGAHAHSCYRALDTSIMDIADDIAYGVHDLEDAIAMGLIHEKLWRDDVMSKPVFAQSNLFNAEQITQWLFAGDSRSLKRAISHLVGAFIRAVELQQQQLFEHPLLDWQAVLTPEAAACLHIVKQFVWDQVISIPEVKSFEYKGQVVVMELFRVFWANPERLLPRSRVAKLDAATSEQQRMRLLCDYVAGMTDDFATRVYAKLFSPYQGSIFDRL